MSTSELTDIAADGIAARRCRRFPVEAVVRLYSGSAMWTTQLTDVSLSGVQVARPAQWNGAVGSRYRLDLRLDGGVVIGMGVVLARLEPNDGLGFRYTLIDMGSFQQLKRLVELNLGSHATLLAEVAALRG
ncbi:MAG TPA: PilZ domain-containing protein [Chiayiivirga sp.]|nr:PilZ domain-containing protein [Chiayiivirga sp.]